MPDLIFPNAPQAGESPETSMQRLAVAFISGSAGKGAPVFTSVRVTALAAGVQLVTGAATHREVLIDNTHATLTVYFAQTQAAVLNAATRKSLPPKSSLVVKTRGDVWVYEATSVAVVEAVITLD